MAMSERNDLDHLRQQMRAVTSEIMQKVQERMDLARQIGEVKSRLDLDVRDEKVEQEVRLVVIKQAASLGMDKDFALRLLNTLLTESEAVQAQGRKSAAPKQTHLAIFQKAKQLEASGKKMIHLEVGEPDYPAPESVGKSLTEAFRSRQYHYTETRGIPQLRNALAKAAGVGEDEVIVTPGGRFAVFSAIAGLLKPGQELITIEPAWPAYRECAEFAGVKTKVLRTSLEDGWTPDIDELRSLVSEGTKMLAINYPNNPTGKILDRKTMSKIVSLARDHDLYLLSDEVYSDYAFRQFDSVLTHDYEKSIVISSFSKTYAMTGFRVGYAVAGSEIIKKMTRVQAVGITSVAEPIQRAALAALSEDASANVRVMEKRLKLVSSKLNEMGLRFVEPDGAMYVYPELPAGDDMSLVESLLEKGVAIAPGSGFGDSYSKFIRISACRPEDELASGLKIMSSVIRK